MIPLAFWDRRESRQCNLNNFFASIPKDFNVAKGFIVMDVDDSHCVISTRKGISPIRGRYGGPIDYPCLVRFEGVLILPSFHLGVVDYGVFVSALWIYGCIGGMLYHDPRYTA